MKNGAEYVLRFGNLTNVAGGENPEDAAAAAAAAGDQKSNDDVNRYMFVMARHNKAAVKQPDLKPLPELPAGAEQPAAEAAPADAAAGTPPADEAKAEAPADDAAKAGAPADTGKTEEPADAKAAEPADDEAKAEADDAAKAADAAKAEDVTKSGDATKAETPPAEPADPAAVDKAKELEKVMAERKRIEQENQRKNDEYQALLKKGEETVKDLNLRFGDWYFVVDDDVFQKIRLGREDVVKKKAPAKPEGATPPAGVTNPFPPTGAPAGLPEVPGAQQ
jgi:hypothetical protein